MDKRKISYIIGSALLLVLAVMVISSIAQDNNKNSSKGKNRVENMQTSNVQSENDNYASEDEKDAAMKEEEDNYQISDKNEANKALEDIDNLVDSAGDIAL